MSRLKRAIAAVLLCLPIVSVAAANSPSATDRAIQFLTNAHTGISMEDSEWLSADVLKAGNVEAFGGLSSLVRQTTAFAKQFGGLKSIAILDVKNVGAAKRIRLQVKFVDEEKRKASPSGAERVDMIWTFIAKEEDGKWKLGSENGGVKWSK